MEANETSREAAAEGSEGRSDEESLTVAEAIATGDSIVRGLTEAWDAGEHHVHAMIDALPEAIYTTDAKGRLTYFNAAAARFSGREPELGTNQWCVSWKLYHPDGTPMPHDECPMAIALKEERSIRGAEAIAERPDGTRRWFEAYPAPLRNDDGEVIGGINMLVDITKRKQVERELRQSERELTDFFENATVGMHWVGPDGTILRANQAELDLLGYSRDEYVGRHIADFYVDQDVIDDILRRLKAAEELNNYEARLRCKDGSIRHVLISSNVYWEDGTFSHTRCVTRDITERKRIEDALRESEERLRFALKAGEIGSWDWDIDSGTVTWSDNLAAIHGMRSGTFDGRFESFIHAVHPDDRDRVLATLHRTLEEDASYHIEHRWVCQNGEVIWLEGKGQVIHDEAGRAVRMSGTCMDITKRKREEQLQEEQTRLLELIAAGAPLEECLSALCTAVPRLSPGVRVAVLLADEQRRSFQRPIAPDLTPTFGEWIEGTPINSQAIDTYGEAVFFGRPVVSKDIADDDIWSESWRDLYQAHDVRACHSTPIRDTDGVSRGAFMLCFDAPRAPNAWEQRLADFGIYIASIALERERARQALYESERRLQLAQETAGLGTWEMNLDTEVLDLSPRAAKLMGLSPDRTTLSGNAWRERIVSNDLPRLIAAIRASLESSAFFDVEFRVRRPDGTVRWVHSRGGVVSDPSDGVPRLYSACLDITERKRREALDQFLAQLNQALQPLADPNEITATAARMLGEHLGVDRCGYFQVEADEDHFVITGGYNRGKVARIEGRWAMSSFGAEAVRLMREDQVYIAEDVEADERLSEAEWAVYEQIEIRSGICVPLHKDGRFAAGMAIHQRTPRSWTSEEVDLVTVVANRCWEALERARVTRELRESEERLRRALAIETVGVSFFDTDGAITDANDAFLEMSGYSRAELEAGQMQWDEMTPPEWIPRARQAVEELEDTGRTTPYEKEYIRKDGSRWWALSATTRLDEGVGVEFIVDVSERKAAEDALRESEKRLHLALEAAKMGAWELDLRSGDSPTRSFRHDRIFGYEEPQEDWDYETFLDHVHPDDRQAVRQSFEEALQAGTWAFECRIIRTDDEQRWIAAQGAFYYNNAQEPVRAIGVIQDITERKRTDQALRELNETLEERVERRTAQVRELTSRLTMAEQQERRRVAQILHDNLQQRLYGIQMRMTFLRKHAVDGAREKLLEGVQQAEAWMDEAIATTRQLSVDLHPPVLKKEGLAEALSWLRTQMRELHGFEVDLETERVARLADENMRVFLFQVVRELLFNVVKHAGVDGATVNIASTGDQLVICVADEGRGFDPSEVERQAHEKGFGLTAAHERLALFGGGLEIESAPGDGTRMTVRAPLDAEQRYAPFKE